MFHCPDQIVGWNQLWSQMQSPKRQLRSWKPNRRHAAIKIKIEECWTRKDNEFIFICRHQEISQAVSEMLHTLTALTITLGKKKIKEFEKNYHSVRFQQVQIPTIVQDQPQYRAKNPVIWAQILKLYVYAIIHVSVYKILKSKNKTASENLHWDKDYQQ